MAKKSKTEQQIVDEPDYQLREDIRIVMESLDGRPEIPIADAKILTSGLVARNKITFILALAQLGSISRAAMAINISTVTVYAWRREDENFKKAFILAMECASDQMEDELLRRACEGVMKPVYQQGRLIGGVREYSDSLLMFALKGSKPDKYADRSKVEHSGELQLVERLRAAREKALKR